MIIPILIMNSMKKKQKQILEKLFMTPPEDFIIPAIVLLGVGMGFLAFGNSLMGMSFMSLGLGFLSGGFGIKSIQLARQSDEKMSVVENINFHRIKGIFEDRRLTLMEKRLKLEKIISSQNPNENSRDDKSFEKWNMYEFEIYFSFSIWKCLTYLQQMEKLKERLSDGEKKSVIKLVEYLYGELYVGRKFLIDNYERNYRITGDYPKHIKSMYNIVDNLGVSGKDEKQFDILADFRDILSENIVEIGRLKKLNEKLIQREEDKEKEKKKRNEM